MRNLTLICHKNGSTVSNFTDGATYIGFGGGTTAQLKDNKGEICVVLIGQPSCHLSGKGIFELAPQTAEVK